MQKTEAIVLKTTPFQDMHQITTLFTPDRGLCSAIGSYSKSPKGALFGLLAPFNHIELIFKPGRSELLKIENGSLLNGHSNIRKSYDLIERGCKILDALLKSQLPNKPAPLLFELLKNYLFLLTEAKSSDAIVASFQVKLLRHEGLIAITNKCPVCSNEPKEIGVEGGQTMCSLHADPLNCLSEEETSYFYALGLASSINFLKEIEIPATLSSKVNHLYESTLFNSPLSKRTLCFPLHAGN